METLATYQTKAIVVGSAAGDLVVEGYAVRWDNVDREGDFWSPGSLTNAIKTFLAGPSPLLYHHAPTKPLGRVTEMQIRDDGVYFKGLVSEVPESSPMRHIYELLRRNLIAGTSIGGFFRKRKEGDGRTRIYDADILELSLSPVPMDPTTSAKVTVIEDGELVERKALQLEFLDEAARALDAIELKLRVAGIKADLHNLRR